MTDTAEILDHVDTTLDERLDRLFNLIRIPSVSTDPAYSQNCQRTAEWLAADLAGMGADASVRQTTGHPMVVAHMPKVEGPHVLFYGHYDVQPADPVELWDSDPFEPVLRPQPDGETHIVGRGAADDKGALMTFVEACRAYIEKRGALPLNVSFLFEGEEESGSASLAPFLEKTADELHTDMVLVCDTDMWDRQTPAITTMLRGLVSQEIVITCADRDLHSGMFGNAARNAAQVLSDVISSLRTPEGGVAIEGFYDGVTDLDPAIADLWARLPFDQEKFLTDIGLTIPAGEAGRSILEQVWARPSCEINGIWSGYTEPGFKTVIPAKASAKVSFRLVAGQAPEKIRTAFQAHVRAHIPDDCSVTFTDYASAPASAMPTDGAFMKATLAALTEEWETEAAIAGTGGSIPIIGEFQKRLGAEALLVGFGRFDNRIHSPNEKFDLSSFHKGIRSWVRILDALSRA